MKLNLGCGPHVLPGWTNLDIDPHPGVIRHDLKNPIPYQSALCDFIFSEHALEHLTKEDGIRLLRECHRMLKPKGVLRLSMPNLDEIVRRYNNNDLYTMPGVWEPQSVCDMINEGMRSWGHQYVWNYSELRRVLSDIGFTSYRMPWRHSDYKDLQNLEVRPSYNDLIVEAIK